MKPESENGTGLAADSPRLSISASRGYDAPESRRRFSTHVAWTLLTRVVMTINSVGAGIIVARWLGAEGVGQLGVINVAVATIVQLSSLGLPSANTYLIAQDKKHLAAAAINSLVFALITGGLLAMALTGLASWWPDLLGSIPPRLVAIAAISIPFQLITLIGLNIFLAVGRVERFNALDLIGQSFVLINAIAALIILNAGLWTLVTLNTASGVVLAVVIIALVGSYGAHVKARWRPDLKLFARMMRYGFKFHIATLAGLLIFRIDLLVVNHFRGPAEAGVYNVASQAAMMLMLLPGVVATLLFPRVAAERVSQSDLTCKVTRHTTFLMFIICVMTVPLAFVLPYLYGPEFHDVTAQLLILLPGVFLIGIESVLVQYFTAIGLPMAIPLFWLATLVINAALTFSLVPPFGARGAAIASTISYALIFALVAVFFRIKTGSTLSNIFMVRVHELRALLMMR